MRTTTATLKKTSAAMIAAGRAVQARGPPSGPASPSSWRNATPTTTVGQHERHQQQRPQHAAAREVEPVAGRTPPGTPSSTDDGGAGGGRPEREPQHPVHPWPRQHLEHAARGRSRPSDQSPSASIPATGSTKKTPSTVSGTAASRARVSSRRASPGVGSPGGDVGPRRSATRRGARRSRPGRACTATSVARANFAHVGGQRDAASHREDVHALRQRGLHLRRSAGSRRGPAPPSGLSAPAQHPGVLHLAEAGVEQRAGGGARRPRRR